jgi:hypothetical protein
MCGIIGGSGFNHESNNEDDVSMTKDIVHARGNESVININEEPDRTNKSMINLKQNGNIDLNNNEQAKEFWNNVHIYMKKTRSEHHKNELVASRNYHGQGTKVPKMRTKVKGNQSS